MKPNEILALVDWESAMKADRCAGGHMAVMYAMFTGSGGTVCAEWREDGWGGQIAVAWLFKDGRVVVATDSFGSCSGCDAWEDATDELAKQLIHDIATNGHGFSSVEEAIKWIETESHEAEHYLDRPTTHLLPALKALLGVKS